MLDIRAIAVSGIISNRPRSVAVRGFYVKINIPVATSVFKSIAARMPSRYLMPNPRWNRSIKH